VPFARNFAGRTSKLLQAQLTAKVTIGIPILRNGFGSNAVLMPAALDDLCFGFWTPPSLSISSEGGRR
jgi:hypothetical protein